MWIRSLEVFRVEAAEPDLWQEEFSHFPLTDPVGSEPHSVGFVTAPETTRLVDELEGRYAFVTGLALRKLPSESIDREAEKRLALLYADPEKPPSKNDRDGVWNKAREDMMPHAPIQEVRTPAVYCSHSRLLYVFGANKKGIEAMQMAVREALGSFVITPLRPKDAVGTLMTQWLRDEPPETLGLGEGLTLEDGEGATCTFKNQDLTAETVLNHLEAGAVVKKMDLLWRGELTFELSAKGEISKIGPPGCKINPKLAFVHWPEIMAKLPAFLAEVMALLGERSLLDGEASSLDDQDATEDHVSEQATPGDRPFVPVVMPPDGGSQALVRRMLDAVGQRWDLAGVVVARRPLDAYRTVYSWAAEQGLPITLMDDPGMVDADCHVPDEASAVVCAGDDEVVRRVAAAATERGIPVYRMQPAQQ